MDEAEAVLERLLDRLLDRLGRIDELRRTGAPAGAMLDELRALLLEAEEWSRTEGGDAGRQAVAGLRAALSSDARTEVVAV
jgi:hypothetical protein